MFGIGMPEMLLILAVALIVIGPKKLPDLAKSLGRALGEFKKATNELKASIELDSDLSDVKKTFKGIDEDLRDSVHANDDPRSAVTTPAEPATGAAGPGETPMENLKSSFEALNESNNTSSQAHSEIAANGKDSAKPSKSKPV